MIETNERKNMLRDDGQQYDDDGIKRKIEVHSSSYHVQVRSCKYANDESNRQTVIVYPIVCFHGAPHFGHVAIREGWSNTRTT